MFAGAVGDLYEFPQAVYVTAATTSNTIPTSFFMETSCLLPRRERSLAGSGQLRRAAVGLCATPMSRAIRLPCSRPAAAARRRRARIVLRPRTFRDC